MLHAETTCSTLKQTYVALFGLVGLGVFLESFAYLPLTREFPTTLTTADKVFM
jgi:type III secretory pathway component EscT